MIDLPLENRRKFDLTKPVFTLDVNQIAIRPPSGRPPGYEQLASIEYNYFETSLVEVAVTPETAYEITQGVADSDLGWAAYQRVEKSRWFKDRPVGSTLSLDARESDNLWLDMRHRLWPTVTDDLLTDNQRADVNQLFFHAVSSGATATNSVFVTTDQNFIAKADDLCHSYGVQVLTPEIAWSTFQPRYELVVASPADVDQVWQQQKDLLARLRRDMT